MLIENKTFREKNNTKIKEMKQKPCNLSQQYKLTILIENIDKTAYSMTSSNEYLLAIILNTLSYQKKSGLPEEMADTRWRAVTVPNEPRTSCHYYETRKPTKKTVKMTQVD